MLGCFDLLLTISSISSFAIVSDFLLRTSASSIILCDLCELLALTGEIDADFCDSTSSFTYNFTYYFTDWWMDADF